MQFNQKAYGERVRDTRKERGFTQETLADALNVSREFITRIEKGRNLCSFEFFISLAVLLDCSADYLLFGDEDDQGKRRTELLAIASQLTALAKNM